MRFSVRLKLIVSLSILVAIGLLAIVLSYRALADVRGAVEALARHQQPLTEAAYELEINVNGIGIAVLAYTEHPLPAYREWIAQDRDDIDRLLQTYLELAGSERERQLGASMNRMNAQFQVRAAALLSRSDALNAALGQIVDRIESADRIIHEWVERIAPAPLSRRDHALTIAGAVLSVEAEMAEVGLALIGSRSDLTHKLRERSRDKLTELRAAVVRLERLQLNATERRLAGRIADLHREILDRIEQVTALEDEIDLLREQFLEQRAQLGRLLHGEVQVLAHQALEAPLRAVGGVTGIGLRSVGFVALPLFVGCALVVGLAIHRSVTRPLNRLTSGIRTVAQADLGHRIDGMPNDEFGDAAAEFNRMTEQLQASAAMRARLPQAEAELLQKDAELRHRETMAQMGALVVGVAHEVRNPLFGMTSTLDALQARMHGQPEHQRHIEVLRGETARLGKLMQDLLDYGKPAPAERSATDLFAVIELAAAACAPLAQSRGARIVCDIPAAAPVIMLDPRGMLQVFVNLIENALQLSPSGSTVTVAGCRDDADAESALVCTVSDSGPGFRDGDLQRVFEPFFTRRRGGTGLGLSIVQRVIETHGGTISAGNRAKGGAVLTLRLPASAARALEPMRT